jgi:hypothetical protein
MAVGFAADGANAERFFSLSFNRRMARLLPCWPLWRPLLSKGKGVLATNRLSAKRAVEAH